MTRQTSNPDSTETPSEKSEEFDSFRFYGRRKGPNLTAHQQDLMQSLLPRLIMDVSGEDEQTVDPFSLFDQNLNAVWLEVGFGKGEHLAAQAAANPDIGMIGCEPYMPGVASLLAKIDDQGLKNVRIYTDDARRILRALAPGRLGRLFLLHPDPWPKKRHAKRRFVGPKALDLIANILQPGGEFRVGTDHPIYRQYKWPGDQILNGWLGLRQIGVKNHWTGLIRAMKKKRLKASPFICVICGMR